MDCTFSSSGKLGVDSEYIFIANNQENLIVLSLCNPPLRDWEWTERDALAKLVLWKAIWTSRVANMSPKDGKV